MSVRVMAAVWGLDLRPTVKLTALALADHADHDGNNARPGVRRLAAKTSQAESTVRDHLRELRDLGVIVATGYAEGGRGHATCYRFTLSPADTFPDVKPTARQEVTENVNPTAGARNPPDQPETLRPAVINPTASQDPTIRNRHIQPSEPSLAAARQTSLTDQERQLLQQSIDENRASLATIGEDTPGSSHPTSISDHLDTALIPNGQYPADGTPTEQQTYYKNAFLVAMVQIAGWDPNGVTGTQWGSMEKQAKALRNLNPPPDAAAVLRTTRIYRAKHPDWECTPAAVVKHWASCQQLPSESVADIRHEVALARTRAAILEEP